MPRQARLDAPGALHHIMVRGIDKTDMFVDHQDKARFLERLGENIAEVKCLTYLGPHGQPRTSAFQKRQARHLIRYAQAPHLVCPIFQSPTQAHRPFIPKLLQIHPLR